ncbi:MAG: H-NS histone family protein [Roseovarius sp.]
MTTTRIDLSDLSLAELEKLQQAVAVAISERRRQARKEARAELERKAREMGFTIEEIFDVANDRKSGKTGKTGRSAPRYADPADPSRTWTGRGRRPKWVEEHLAQGKSLEDLAI